MGRIFRALYTYIRMSVQYVLIEWLSIDGSDSTVPIAQRPLNPAHIRSCDEFAKRGVERTIPLAQRACRDKAPRESSAQDAQKRVHAVPHALS